MSDKMMKALELKDGTMQVISIPKPTPADNEILVKVKYSAIDTALDAIAHREIDAFFIKDMKAKPMIAGYHFSGTVEQVGANVTDYKIGDGAFGLLQCASTTKQGAYSEYITVPTDACAKKPPTVAWDVAAASTTETLTALQAMRDKAGLTKGKSVLILGAGGGVGGAAVGVAKSMGASSITAVSSTRDVERVKALGADVVVDRRAVDLTKALGKYDVVFDTASKYRLWHGTQWLKPYGGFVNTLPTVVDVLLLGWIWKLVTGKSFKSVHVWSKKDDLELTADWLVKGSLKIEIDSVHDIGKFSDAWERHRESGKVGRVVIKVEGGW